MRSRSRTGICVALLTALAGCGPMQIRAPRVAGAPAAVYLADYGRHSSLILPRPGGARVEYAYGWWPWFALNHQQWYDAIPLFIFPGEGALARRSLPEDADAETLRRDLGLEHVELISVEPARAAALLAHLDAAYEAHRDAEIANPATAMTCVPSDRAYSLINNCNTAVTEWLETLGCGLCGQTFLANFDVESPAP